MFKSVKQYLKNRRERKLKMQILKNYKGNPEYLPFIYAFITGAGSSASP